MSDRRGTPWWRWLLCIAIAYITFEAWAQYRFSLENPIMPFGMRANMGVDFYEAFKPKANFRGHSAKGELFITDEYGFRVSEEALSSSNNPAILVGGDSRIYGYSLPFPQSFSATLSQLQDCPIHLQAYPGGSPALFNHEMWTLGVFDRIEPRPEVVIYDYDTHDGYGDRDFKAQQKKSSLKTTLTRIKLSLGGYGIQRMQTIAREFLGQWKEDWPKGWNFSGAKPTPPQNENSSQPSAIKEEIKRKHPRGSKPQWIHYSSVPIDVAEIRKMKEECEKRGVRLIFLYQPRLLEISRRDSKMLDELASLCQKLDLEFIETFSDIDASLSSKELDYEDWFSEPKEGIHLTSEALQHAAQKVHRHLKESQP